MITEDYVSFETAKLLKEKGFDECCRVKYKYVKEFDRYLQTTEYVDDGFEKYYYPCPTLQMAMKWLRGVYGLFIRITEDITGKVFGWSVYQKNYGCRVSTYVEDSYEQACEAAIKFCLENLI